MNNESLVKELEGMVASDLITDDTLYELTYNNMSELKRIKYLFGHIPILEVKVGKNIVDIVQFNDNLFELHQDQGEDYCSLWSRGLEKLDSGQMVEIKSEGAYPTAEIITDEEAIKLIVGCKKFDLINKFGLQEKAHEILLDY